LILDQIAEKKDIIDNIKICKENREKRQKEKNSGVFVFRNNSSTY